MVWLWKRKERKRRRDGEDDGWDGDGYGLVGGTWLWAGGASRGGKPRFRQERQGTDSGKALRKGCTGAFWGTSGWLLASAQSAHALLPGADFTYRGAFLVF